MPALQGHSLSTEEGHHVNKEREGENEILQQKEHTKEGFIPGQAGRGENRGACVVPKKQKGCRERSQ